MFSSAEALNASFLNLSAAQEPCIDAAEMAEAWAALQTTNDDAVFASIYHGLTAMFDQRLRGKHAPLEPIDLRFVAIVSRKRKGEDSLEEEKEEENNRIQTSMFFLRVSFFLLVCSSLLVSD